MGRKRSRVDYRQKYKDYYNIDFGREMVVHHIDFNRGNNDISNLLLLPNNLHAKYHLTLQMLTGIDGSLSLNKELQLYEPGTFYHYPQWLRKMAEVIDEIAPWYRLKMDLDMLPREVFASAYRTTYVITPDSVR